MVTDRDGKQWLEDAYKLATPADNKRYYEGFADAYDAEFAQSLSYIYPASIAEIYHSLKRVEDVPVADIGCGTGLVAEALNLERSQVEGFDISQKMLEVARNKTLYGALHDADITMPLEGLDAKFGAVVSAGTFTHGHLGPEPLVHLLKIARPGGLFVIGANQTHFETEGFKSVLDDLATAGEIVELRLRDTAIYGDTTHEHGNDRALVISYRRAS